MTWRLEKVEEQRELLVRKYLDKEASMSELCRDFGVSRKTGYKWLERYQQGGSKALVNQSRAPKEPCKVYSDDAMQLALELKQKYPTFGPKKIHALLKRKFPQQDWPSPTRLYLVFKDHHLVCSRKLRRRVPRTHPLGHANTSNDVWCADFKGWFLTKDKTKVQPLTITDAFSRYVIVCQHLDRANFESVWEAYTQAFEQYGLPLRIRSDNGPPFATTGVGRLSRLAVRLIQAGVTPEWINPGHPEENGRHERFHRTLKAAVASPAAESLAEQEQSMIAFADEYNFERPHESLNQQVPGAIYTPSDRIWKGALRSPEYDTSLVKLRKVCPNGCIHWKQMPCYLAQLLAGEYVGLQEVDNGQYDVYYGPVLLGRITEKVGFQKPQLPRRH